MYNSVYFLFRLVTFNISTNCLLQWPTFLASIGGSWLAFFILFYLTLQLAGIPLVCHYFPPVSQHLLVVVFLVDCFCATSSLHLNQCPLNFNLLITIVVVTFGKSPYSICCCLLLYCKVCLFCLSALAQTKSTLIVDWILP